MLEFIRGLPIFSLFILKLINFKFIENLKLKIRNYKTGWLLILLFSIFFVLVWVDTVSAAAILVRPNSIDAVFRAGKKAAHCPSHTG